MHPVYKFALQLQDLVSGPLREIYSRYSSTMSSMQNATNRWKSSFSGATQSIEEQRRTLEQLKGRRVLLINNNDMKRA